MIPLVGFIISVYCIARLLQVPIEHGNAERLRLIPLWLISIAAIGVIGFLALDLFFRGLSTGSSVQGMLR